MHLVIQAEEVYTQDLKQIARRCGARQIERISAQAFRLIPALPSPDVEQYCTGAEVDWAWQERVEYLHEYGLLALDMDSTLITIECIDEIAGACGKRAEVAAITAQAMRGGLDFQESLRRRVALLAGTPVGVLEEIYDRVLRLSPGAERLLAAAQAAGVKTMLISGGFTFFTERLRKRLGLDAAVGNVLETAHGRLTGRISGPILDAAGKAEALRTAAAAFGAARTVAIGDGANDLPMLAAATTSIAYRAKPVVQEQARYRLNHCGLEGVLALLLPAREG